MYDSSAIDFLARVMIIAIAVGALLLVAAATVLARDLRTRHRAPIPSPRADRVTLVS